MPDGSAPWSTRSSGAAPATAERCRRAPVLVEEDVRWIIVRRSYIQEGEPRVEQESSTTGRAPDAASQSIPTEDEELYTVLLTVRPVSVSGSPPSPEAEIQTENRMWQELQEGMDKLRTAFQEIVDPALYTPERHYSIEIPGVGSNVLQGVRFTLRGLSTQRGSITLIAILGAVYVGAKDYETLRKSLLVLADDIRRMLARVHVSSRCQHGGT